VSVGRASLQLRNSANSAPDWAEAWPRNQGEDRADDAQPFAGLHTAKDGTEFARLIVPIAITAPCLMCHGLDDKL
jgi:hypothetical protein